MNVKLQEYLRAFGKKYITFEDLQAFQNKEYEELYKEITQLLQKGVLVAVNNRKTNARNPSLPQKFQILLQEEKNELFSLSAKIDIAYYLHHFEEFQKDRGVISKIDEFLKSELKTVVSVRERAYELFDDEKALEKDTHILKVLKNTKIDIQEQLLTFKSREPFYIYTFRTPIRSILISENQAAFFNFYLLYKEGLAPFDGVIFGQGNKILQSFEFIHGYVPDDAQFFYWGDIDSYGLNIVIKLIEKYASAHIALWQPGYRYMLEHGKRKIAKKSMNLDNHPTHPLLMEFIEVVHRHEIIPQEALNFQVLKQLLIEASDFATMDGHNDRHV